MQWLRDYSATTLFFWKDAPEPSIEQFTFLPGVYGGVFYGIYQKLSGVTPPKLSLSQYVFPVILILVLFHYTATVKTRSIFNTFFRFVRVCILHISISMLFYVSFKSVPKLIPEMLYNTHLLLIGIGCTTLLLGYHTFRTYISGPGSAPETNPQKAFWWPLLVSGTVVTVVSWLFSFYFVFPGQG